MGTQRITTRYDWEAEQIAEELRREASAAVVKRAGTSLRSAVWTGPWNGTTSALFATCSMSGTHGSMAYWSSYETKKRGALHRPKLATPGASPWQSRGISRRKRRASRPGDRRRLRETTLFQSSAALDHDLLRVGGRADRQRAAT